MVRSARAPLPLVVGEIVSFICSFYCFTAVFGPGFGAGLHVPGMEQLETAAPHTHAHRWVEPLSGMENNWRVNKFISSSRGRIEGDEEGGG